MARRAAAALTVGLVLMCVLPSHAADTHAARPRSAHAFDPTRAGIRALRTALDGGRLSYEDLVRYYLDRIARLDRAGPGIHSLIRLNPDALAQARRLDAARFGPGPGPAHGWLYGIPFVAKDNFDSAGLATSGGSAVLKDSTPSTNARVLQSVLDQGAILLGKANLSELAASYGRLGYSSAGGLTLNPHNLARNASGSSSGSAAAVAADFAAFALGSDTSGSIRGPASVTGVVGLRPTLGLVSRRGVIPLAGAFDTAGALTRSVEDMAFVLDAIAGTDPEDAATHDQPARPGSYAAALAGASLEGVRLGVVTNFRGANDEVDAAEDAGLALLRARGAVLEPVSLPEAFEHLWEGVIGPVSEAEFKPQFERYLQSLPGDGPKSLAQFILASEATPVNPGRLEGLREAEATRLTESPETIRLVSRVIPELRQQLLALMQTRGLRALVFATLSCPASPRFDRPDPAYVCRSDDPYRAAYVASAVGFPELTLPVAMARRHLPVGFSWVGAPYSEAQLLALATAFERSLPPIPPPIMR